MARPSPLSLQLSTSTPLHHEWPTFSSQEHLHTDKNSWTHKTQSEEHRRETQGLGEPCGDTDTRQTRGDALPAPTARSTARLTSEVGDVMMSEHGCRAWVLGQGQAATGTNTRSTSCGQQRARQSLPRTAGHRATEESRAPLARDVSASSLQWCSLFEGESPVCSRLGGRKSCPLGDRVAAPRAAGWTGCLALSVTPPGGSLGSRTQVGSSRPDQGVHGLSPDNHTASPAKIQVCTRLGYHLAGNSPQAQVTQIMVVRGQQRGPQRGRVPFTP